MDTYKVGPYQLKDRFLLHLQGLFHLPSIYKYYNSIAAHLVISARTNTEAPRSLTTDWSPLQIIQLPP